jgi:hypothetical protein
MMSKYILSAGCYELLYAKGDVDAWLAKARAAGANSCRFFAEASWIIPKNAVMAPYAWDGKQYIMNKWDAAYWQRFVSLIKLMKKHGIRPHIVLFDFCSWKMRPPWLKYCTWFNAKHIPHNSAGQVDHLGPASLKYQLRYVSKIVEKCKKYGVDADYEINNEYWWIGYRPDQGIKWHGAIVDHLLSLGVKKSSLITSVKWNLDMDILGPMLKQVGWYQLHGAGGRDGEIVWKAVEAIRKYTQVGLSSDGVFKGQGAADNEGSRGNSAAEMIKIAKLMKLHKIYRYDFKDRGISDKTTESPLTACGVISNVDLAHLEPLAAMYKELSK